MKQLSLASQIILLLLPILITSLTQIIKVSLHTIQRGKLKVKDYYMWGGFPSSHSALIGSLATLIALIDGFFSVTFLITISFGILVLRDATGLRNFAENHAKAINFLRTKLSTADQKKVPHQVSSIGHTRLEVAGGVIIGSVVTLLVYYLLLAFA